MIKTYFPSTQPCSPLRESILSCQLVTPKAPRPVKRIHEVDSPVRAIQCPDELKLENRKGCVTKTTPVTHHSSLHKLHSQGAYATIPKTPDGQQLVHRRRTSKRECPKSEEGNQTKWKCAVEFPFLIPLDDDETVQVVEKNETDSDRLGNDVYESTTGLELVSDDEVDSFSPWKVMEYKVGHKEKSASMSECDRAQEKSSVPLPQAVEVESVLSNWSDLSDSDDDCFISLQEKTFQNVIVAETVANRCNHNASSYVLMHRQLDRRSSNMCWNNS